MKSRIWYQIAMYSFFFFVLTILGVQNNVLDLFDEKLISFIIQFENPLLTSILITITNIGSFYGTVVVWGLFLYVSIARKWHHEAILLTIITFTTHIVNLVVKNLFLRPRPELHQLIEISGYSFPSGHTMYATSLYGTALILFWKKCNFTWQRTILVSMTLLIIFLIALSRIYLGVHYPSDIIGGFFLSLLLISVTLYLFLLKEVKNKECNRNIP